MAFWHGRILPATFYFRRRGIVVITSENFDGEWIARIIERFGYGTARGSTSRGARKAMLQLVRDDEAGKPAGFTLDGPRGPARVAQPGAVWLAGATGNPMLPFHLEAAHAWTLRSWDRTQIPEAVQHRGAGRRRADRGDGPTRRTNSAKQPARCWRRRWPRSSGARPPSFVRLVSPRVFSAPAESLP